MFDDLTLQGTLFQTDGEAYEKRSLAKQRSVHTGKTKNGSIRRKAELSG